MKNDVKSKHLEIGELGENIACRFLKEKGFEILGRNYRKKWGEIDIIAKKSGIIHFVEVNTVSRENLQNFSRETDNYRPEENVHPWKLKRLGRAIQTYLAENNLENTDWKFDVAAVYLDLPRKEAKVYMLEDVIL